MESIRCKYSYLSAINEEMRLAFLNFNECSHSIYYRIDKSGSILINASSKQPSVIFLGSFYSALTSFTSCIIKLNSVKESLPPPKKTKETIRPEAKSVNVLDVAYELRDEIEKLKTHKINPLLYFFIEFCKCHRINIYDMHPLDIRKNFMTFIYHKPYYTSVANPIKDMSKESVNDNETRKTKVINKKQIKEFYFSAEKNIASCINYIDDLVKIHGGLRVVAMRLGIIPNKDIFDDPFKRATSFLDCESDLISMLHLKDRLLRNLVRDAILKNMVGYIMKVDHSPYIGFHIHFISIFTSDIESDLPLLIYEFWNNRITEKTGCTWGYRFESPASRNAYGDEYTLSIDDSKDKLDLKSFIRQMLLRDKLIKIDIPKRRTLERGIIRDTIENRILLSSEKRDILRDIFRKAKDDNVSIKSLVEFFSQV